MVLAFTMLGFSHSAYAVGQRFDGDGRGHGHVGYIDGDGGSLPLGMEDASVVECDGDGSSA
jgi:hypothetical protein